MHVDQSSEAISRCVEALQGKWTAQILLKVSAGIQRFGALRREIPSISPQSLMQVLRKMEKLGVLRQESGPRPQQKDYQLTDKGKTLLIVVEAMREWGDAQFREEQKAKQQRPLPSTMTRLSLEAPLTAGKRT